MGKELSELAKYLIGVMEERNLSIRALAAQAGVAHGTIQNILAGKPVDPKTLNKLADYLNMPVDTLYRMAGMIPAEEQRKQDTIRVIEHLVARLPESDQEEILQIIRMKIDRQSKS